MIVISLWHELRTDQTSHIVQKSNLNPMPGIKTMRTWQRPKNTLKIGRKAAKIGKYERLEVWKKVEN